VQYEYHTGVDWPFRHLANARWPETNESKHGPESLIEKLVILHSGPTPTVILFSVFYT